MIGAMKKALGDIIDPVSLQAMEVSAVMAQAGASQEDIEEMMAMILSQGSGVSADFIDSIKEAMQGGGKENITYPASANISYLRALNLIRTRQNTRLATKYHVTFSSVRYRRCKRENSCRPEFRLRRPVRSLVCILFNKLCKDIFFEVTA